jgi:hypothetical protein
LGGRLGLEGTRRLCAQGVQCAAMDGRQPKLKCNAAGARRAWRRLCVESVCTHTSACGRGVATVRSGLAVRTRLVKGKKCGAVRGVDEKNMPSPPAPLPLLPRPPLHHPLHSHALKSLSNTHTKQVSSHGEPPSPSYSLSHDTERAFLPLPSPSPLPPPPPPPPPPHLPLKPLKPPTPSRPHRPLDLIAPQR